MAVVVHAASSHARDGAKRVRAKVATRAPRRHLGWADGGAAGTLIDRVRDSGGGRLPSSKRSDDGGGFPVLPPGTRRRGCWVVARTCAWLGRYRRLSKDDEGCPESSEALILIALIHRMVRRLAPGC